MRHVSSQQLRRLADDPMAVPDQARRHLASCAWCKTESAQAAEDAALAARLVSAPPGDGDIDLEWAMFTARLATPGGAPAAGRGWPIPRRISRRLARVSLGTGTAVLAGVLAVGAGAAAVLTTVYAPTHVAPVRVDATDLRAIESITGIRASQLPAGLPAFGSRRLAFGTLSWTTAGRAGQVASIARATALTHLPWSAPTALPRGVGRPRGIAVQPRVTATVSFGRRAGRGIAGSTLEITGGPAIAVQYAGRSGPGGLTTLIIVAMRRPVASSTGATAGQLTRFLLTRGGLPAAMARNLRLLGSPGTTLPVPVPPGMNTQRVRVGGAAAVLVAAPSDVASAVIWEGADGIVHAVGGLLDSEDVLSVARQIG
jgi:hypothetical protein